MKLKPKPVIASLVCSVCDLDWGRHPENPKVTDCIELLKAEARRAPIYWSWNNQTWTQPGTYSLSYSN